MPFDACITLSTTTKSGIYIVTISVQRGLFSSEFKYASYYSCMVSILDGSVIVVSLITFRYFVVFFYSYLVTR